MLKVFLAFIFGVLGTLACAAPAAVQAASVDRMVLHLDDSFIGHPVSLSVFDGAAKISWDTGGLVKSGDIDVRLTHGAVTVIPSSVGMFAPSALAVSFPSMQTSSTWDQNAVQALDGSNAWRTLTSTIANGWVTGKATVSGVVSFHIVQIPTGMRSGVASWYAYKNCNCAASPDFPKGTKLLVKRADDPSRSVVVTVNDYGPDRSLFPERVIDLDKVAFSAIGNPRGGVMQVTVEPYVVPTVKQTTSS